MAEMLDIYKSGDRLYGDDFAPEELAEWVEAEKLGYANIAKPEDYDPQAAEAYGYHALNEAHGFRYLRHRRYARCVALGCGTGEDIRPIAPLVDEFYCVEPAPSFWRDEIGGTPARYVVPTVQGTLDLEDGSADLVISLGTLHHVANVTYVLSEVARVLRAGGLLVLREPISSMGDWRKPRPGLTKNERGLPLAWLNRTTRSLGFTPVRRGLCMFGPLRYAAVKMRLTKPPFNHKGYVFVDAVFSAVTSFNSHYWRDTTWKRVAPGSVFAIYKRD